MRLTYSTVIVNGTEETDSTVIVDGTDETDSLMK